MKASGFVICVFLSVSAHKERKRRGRSGTQGCITLSYEEVANQLRSPRIEAASEELMKSSERCDCKRQVITAILPSFGFSDTRSAAVLEKS